MVALGFYDRIRFINNFIAHVCKRCLFYPACLSKLSDNLISVYYASINQAQQHQNYIRRENRIQLMGGRDFKPLGITIVKPRLS